MFKKVKKKKNVTGFDWNGRQKALETVGFASEEITNIFRVVAAVLKLGNLVFDPVNNIDGTEGCCINNEYGNHSLTFNIIHRKKNIKIKSNHS